ncbi:hypothetical protein BOTBODRAFT_264424 [Botryobasidium botryosum FD-172 SS1]|uniref:Uncharacterized protein n=1 Tax=Botryobasidium botryosum (strain FD-172 SS1) TaxID=930990 RepID=A0A067M2U9_BOTB1|nr:hypothetical protein BOTBODRAFT_264424 [Botryobasidium botryosum FD-172 SS1]
MKNSHGPEVGGHTGKSLGNNHRDGNGIVRGLDVDLEESTGGVDNGFNGSKALPFPLNVDVVRALIRVTILSLTILILLAMRGINEEYAMGVALNWRRRIWEPPRRCPCP